MGKIVMPKNSALLNEVESVLKIYYNAGDWLENASYKDQLKELIGDSQYSSSYTKKAQMTSYFGFTEWEDIDNARSKRRITKSGVRMYDAIVAEDTTEIQEIIMESLESVVFGRNNFGVPESNSDIEPPNLFIRAILDLGYLTYKEFAFLLWEMVDVGKEYTDAKDELINHREHSTLEIHPDGVKYIDCKPIMMLVRWGFLTEEDTRTEHGTKITIRSEVYRKYKHRLSNLKIYNVDKNVNFESITQIDERKRISGGANILLYGVPGSGKSHTIEKEYCSDSTRMERIVFHPDYMNTDFIGQILPSIKKDKTITYKFTPGPFTRILRKAYINPEEMFYLVVEEINRGNAPAIFGETFQLLDRESDGSSSYSITNYNVADIVYEQSEKPLTIPSNLIILATMNTADQNVFTLDTAFQRRWTMRMVENDVSKAEHAEMEILDTGVTWERFNNVINDQILNSNSSTMSSEDKRLGAYFITKETLLKDIQNFDGIAEIEKFHSLFAEKVIKYLWDDAFKFGRDRLFVTTNKSLEKVINEFSNSKGESRFDIFNESIKDLLLKKVEDSSNLGQATDDNQNSEVDNDRN